MKCPICEHDTPHTFAVDRSGPICEAGSCDCQRMWKLRAESLVLQRDAAMDMNKKSVEYEHDLHWLWRAARSKAAAEEALFDTHAEVRPETRDIVSFVHRAMTADKAERYCCCKTAVPYVTAFTTDGGRTTAFRFELKCRNHPVKPRTYQNFVAAPCGFVPVEGWPNEYARDGHRDSCDRCGDVEADAIRNAPTPRPKLSREQILHAIKAIVGEPGEAFTEAIQRAVVAVCDRELS